MRMTAHYSNDNLQLGQRSGAAPCNSNSNSCGGIESAGASGSRSNRLLVAVVVAVVVVDNLGPVRD